MSGKLESSSSQFCRTCGLCCNGVLHAYTSVHPDEVELVRTLGLALVPRKGALSFKQPCRLYKKECCSNYRRRPSACRQYQCALLKKYLAGKLAAESGERIIRRSKELYAALLTAIPDGWSFDQLRSAWDSEEYPDQAPLFRELSRFIQYLQRHFGE